MVFEYLPQLGIVLSLFVIIIIIARKLPKTAEIDDKKVKGGKKKSEIRKIFSIIWDNIKKIYYRVFGKLKTKAKEVKEKTQVVDEKATGEELSQLAKEKPGSDDIPQASADEIIDLLEKASNFYGKGEFDRAEKIYIEIISKDKRNIRAYKGLGKIYKRQRNFKYAKSSYEQALKIEPEDKEARQKLKEVKSLIKK